MNNRTLVGQRRVLDTIMGVSVPVWIQSFLYGTSLTSFIAPRKNWYLVGAKYDSVRQETGVLCIYAELVVKRLIRHHPFHIHKAWSI